MFYTNSITIIDQFSSPRARYISHSTHVWITGAVIHYCWIQWVEVVHQKARGKINGKECNKCGVKSPVYVPVFTRVCARLDPVTGRGRWRSSAENNAEVQYVLLKTLIGFISYIKHISAPPSCILFGMHDITCSFCQSHDN